jgi:hypothetical protein
MWAFGLGVRGGVKWLIRLGNIFLEILLPGLGEGNWGVWFMKRAAQVILKNLG